MASTLQDMTSSTVATFKYTVVHYRAKNVSPEAFEKWYHEVHLPKALVLMKKHGMTKFTVVVRDDSLCANLQPDVDAVFPTWEISEADVVLEYEMPSLGSMRAMIADPDWLGLACVNLDQWIDMQRCTLHLGRGKVYLAEGKALEEAVDAQGVYKA